MPDSLLEILVIDDCPEDREEIRALLLENTSQRYHIREAQSGAEGARALQEYIPDCILLDYRLPDQDGLLLLRKWKEGEGTGPCPVVVMTGSLDRRISVSALHSGAQDFLAKNELTPELLSRTIEHALLRYRILREQQDTIKALAEKEHLLRTGQEAAGVGTFDWNLISGACSFGGDYFKLYGQPNHHPPISFEQWLEFIHPEDRARVRLETEQAIANAGDFSYEYRVVRPDRSVRWILGRGAVVSDGLGDPQRVTGVNVDVTELRLTKEALMAVNQELQHFAYTAGHDLQAPLRTVGVFTELLEQNLGRDTNEVTRDALNQVRTSAQRMHALVGDLLLYAQAGSVSRPQRKRVSIEKALDMALENLKSDLEDSGAKLVWEDLPTVESYGEELVQVFQNLVGNAIQYRRAGTPPVIRITATPRAPDWIVAVEDNGEGFDMASSTLIFQAFKRLDGRRPGTGLGLAICKRIIERAGGHIWAEAEPGNGATFFFTLPMAAREERAEAATAPAGWKSPVA